MAAAEARIAAQKVSDEISPERAKLIVDDFIRNRHTSVRWARWVLAKREVSTPIVGASKPAHLEDAIAALDLVLSDDEIARLEAPYVPHAVVGFS